MKKLVVVLVLISTPAFAGLRIGGLLGYHSDNLETTETGVTYSRVWDFQFGGILMISVLDTVAFRTGLIFVDRQANGTSTQSGTEVNYKVKSAYVEVPLNLQVNLMSWYVFGGLKYGFRGSTTCSVSTPPGSTCETKTTPTNTMMNLGLGYELFDLELVRFGIEGEYEKGLSNINDAGNSTELRTESYGVNLVGTVGF